MNDREMKIAHRLFEMGQTVDDRQIMREVRHIGGDLINQIPMELREEDARRYADQTLANPVLDPANIGVVKRQREDAKNVILGHLKEAVQEIDSRKARPASPMLPGAAQSSETPGAAQSSETPGAAQSSETPGAAQSSETPNATHTNPTPTTTKIPESDAESWRLDKVVLGMYQDLAGWSQLPCEESTMQRCRHTFCRGNRTLVLLTILAAAIILALVIRLIVTQAAQK